MKRIKSTVLYCAATLSFYAASSLTALADQCAYITKSQAIEAIARLELNDRIYFFCEPCGEEIPQPAEITSLSAGTVDYEDYWQVNINGKGIDLAYVFVDSGIEQNFVNLAAIANCPAQIVSPTLPQNQLKEDSQSAQDGHEGS
ncbi:MAG: hypothetical protein AAFQ41_01925 [Cyanobacteria bacterium J06623_7]